MAVEKPGRGADQFPLRLPDGMRDWIKSEAERNKRSMNAEIVARLEQSLSGVSVTLPAELRVRIEESAKRSHRPFADELWHALDYLFPASPVEPPPIPTGYDASDFEREFVQASHDMMLRLMRKHGMNPVDSRELLATDEYPTPLDLPETRPPAKKQRNR